MECSLCCRRLTSTKSCNACALSVCAACARKWLEEGRDPACPGCFQPWEVAEVRARAGSAFLTGPYRHARRRVLLHAQLPLLNRATRLAQRERERRHAKTSGAPRPVSSHVGRCCACSCVVDANGRCEACGVVTCAECGEMRDPRHEPHQCNPDVLASRAAVLRDCRPCVQCDAPTVRIEGCPTMWCPHCHAFWNWDTGRLIPSRSAPHNPDHRAWARTRELLDVPCGGIPDGSALNNAYVREYVQHNYELLEFNAFGVLAAWESVLVAITIRRTLQPRDDVQALRVARLLGDITDDQLSVILERRERTEHFHRAVDTLLETYVHSCAYVLQRFTEPERTAHRQITCASCMRELEAVREFIVDALRAAGVAHARKPPLLNDVWMWTTSRTPRAVLRPRRIAFL